MLTPLVLMLASLAAGEEAVEERYAWPLDLPRILTSSFAEYRPGRFHMGIDLRTGPIGKDVFAAAGGHVVRVRCSPYGYGKAVYVRFDDGVTAVYAHLDEFAPDLRQYVRQSQHARRSYTVDLYPEPGQFPVAKGDLIAKSGQTGTGVPHLHYELRAPSGKPINPRTLGLDWPDPTTPIVRKALIVPLSPETTLDGDYKPLVRDVRDLGGGQYALDPVAITGPAALGIDVIDPANNGANKLGVHTIETALDGAPVFTLHHEEVAYANNGDGVVAYHPFFMDEGRFLMQWRWPGNNVESFNRGRRDGAFTLSGDTGELTARIADYHDNEAVLTVPLERDTFTPPDVPPNAEGGDGVVTFDTFGQWVLFSVRFAQPEGTAPELVREGGATEAIPFRRVGRRTFRAPLVPNPGEQRVRVYVDHPRVEGERHPFAFHRRGDAESTAKFNVQSSPTHEVRIHMPPGAPYGHLVVKATSETLTEVPPGYRAEGRSYTIWPAGAPIDAPVTLSFPAPGENAALYRKSGRTWRYAGGKRGGNGRVTLETRTLGTYAFLEDLEPPRIAIEAPGPHDRLDTDRPAIRARTSDAESGIDTFEAVLENGQWLLFEFDPERGLLQWERDEPLPSGEHVLTITVTDQAGNRNTAQASLRVP